jgi:hypothetical protein
MSVPFKFGELQSWLHICGCVILPLNDEVLALPRRQEIPQVRQRPYFHLALRILILRAHVRQQRDLGEFEKAWINVRLVREDVKTRR